MARARRWVADGVGFFAAFDFACIRLGLVGVVRFAAAFFAGLAETFVGFADALVDFADIASSFESECLTALEASRSLVSMIPRCRVIADWSNLTP
ncbi:hypothetical protein BH11MYX2_BH11MYX2_15310 [soil metagenome]